MNRDWNQAYMSLVLFWNSLDNAPSSIDFYLEIKVEVGHDIRSRFPPRRNLIEGDKKKVLNKKYLTSKNALKFDNFKI